MLLLKRLKTLLGLKDKVKVKYFDPALPEIQMTEKGDWIDLRSRIGVDYKAGDYVKIPLGIAMKLPEGKEAWVVSRGSTFKKFGIIQANPPGIVDNSFCGDGDEWHFFGIALKDGRIAKMDRICQFRIIDKMDVNSPVKFETVRYLGNPDRGMQGSTGYK